MICEINNNSVHIEIGETEYVSIRVRRRKGLSTEKVCAVFQDAKGNSIIEYQDKRILDEREMFTL